MYLVSVCVVCVTISAEIMPVVIGQNRAEKENYQRVRINWPLSRPRMDHPPTVGFRKRYFRHINKKVAIFVMLSSYQQTKRLHNEKYSKNEDYLKIE